MQILLAPDGPPGTPPEGIAPLEPVAVELELLGDFLSRLQAIVRGPRADAPGSPDDTRPAGRRARP
ncbi:MAG: hypothetical protein ACM3SU_17435 [Acidobacteriota bacterium]